jgi:hypothetical protein
MAGSLDLLDVPLVVDETGADVGDIRVVVSDRYTEIRGTLEAGDGTPLGHHTVFVVTSDETYWGKPGRRLARAETNDAGTFTVRGLPAGNYYVAVSDAQRHDDWWSFESLRAIKAASIALTLTADKPTVLRLRRP